MESLENKLREMLLSAGAGVVGYCDLRGLPAEIRRNLPFGVSIGMGLDRGIISRISAGPTLEYEAEYNRANAALAELADKAADFLIRAGYRAWATVPTPNKATLDMQTLATPLPHKTVATRAGLGWIGRTALLVTRQFGSALRLSSVLTDAPLTPAEPMDESKCGRCDKCVRICPAGAATGQSWRVGMAREKLINVFACLKNIKARMPDVGLSHTVCGMCIAACPHTRRYLAQANKL